MLELAPLPSLYRFFRLDKFPPRKLHSLVTGRPLDVVALPPPSPPTVPKPRPPGEAIAPRWKYSEAKPMHVRHLRYIRDLECGLRLAFRSNVSWPAPTADVERMNLWQYVREMLVQPIADLFNQIYSKNVYIMPLVWKSPRIDEDTYALTFEANDLRKRTNIFTTPIVIFINGSLFDQDGSPSSGMMATLEEAYDNKPHSTAIATNLEEIAVFSSPYSTTERSFERISTSRALPALRVIAAAYLKYSLMIHSYIPAPDPEHDEDLILPEGPPIDPQDSLPTDQEILETRFRQSDFDLATLMRDRNRALQFLRWKDHVQKTQDKLVAHPGDNISAASNSFSRAVPELKPYYPFKLSDLSADTVGHLTSIQRVCPLSVGSLRERLHHSKQLSLRILGVASKGSGGGICTVYRCQLTSIDGKDVTSPDLCLKLFDDRFQRLELPDEYESEENPARWFDRIVLAELHLRQEDAAYKKLSAVQGSIVPWYYGSHLFTLPSGLKLYGILLEYITGLLLDSDDVGKLSPERQIQLIQSCRHGARVLDIADIAQHDWHPHQILVHSLPETDTMHAVLLDFASTTQTIDPAIFTYLSNFHSCLAVLTGALGKVAVNRDLAIDHFGTPDYWDPVMTIVPRGPGRDSKVFESPDPFPFIHKS